MNHFFFCLDANACARRTRWGFRFSRLVSVTPVGPSFLRDFLDAFELCLPITSDSHKGTAITWTSPDDGEYTIDYVAIPRAWMGACDHSCVLTDFDLANVNLDHSAVAIDLQWTQVASARIKAKTEIRDFERSPHQQRR